MLRFLAGIIFGLLLGGGLMAMTGSERVLDLAMALPNLSLKALAVTLSEPSPVVMALAATYALFIAFTFFFLLRVGRRGLIRRCIQLVVSLFWPAYWPIIQGPRRSAVMFAKFITSLLFLALLPVTLIYIGMDFFFEVLSRFGLAPRFIAEA